jgi:broad specificity phosphatase PhoE
MMCGGVDSGAFDPETKLVFESCGEGILSVIHQLAPDTYDLVQSVPTQFRAKTMAFDPKTNLASEFYSDGLPCPPRGIRKRRKGRSRDRAGPHCAWHRTSTTCRRSTEGPTDSHFSSMTSSTMTRAKQPAAVIHDTLSDVPVESSPLLSECTPPARLPKTTVTPEEVNQCQSRVNVVFKIYFVPSKRADESDILVAHGNVIRLLVMRALGVDPQAWLGMSVAHASLTVVRVKRDGSVVVLSVGDIGHIPPILQGWESDSDPQLVVPQTPRG